MAEVEILLGTLNGGRYLGPQLSSFAGQSLCNWTLRVSDDGSTDDTLDILSRFGAARPGSGLRLHTGPKCGVSANYLHLLKHADRKAPFLALADQDDIWFPMKLSRGVSALRALPSTRPALYAAQSSLIDADGRAIRSRRPRRRPRPSFQNALVQNICAGNTIILNRAAADLAARAEPVVSPPFHDWWLYALMTGAGATVVIDADPVLAYRQHARSYLGANAGRAARLARLRLVMNGTWRQWLAAHHRALASVSHHLLPEHRSDVLALTEPAGSFIRLQTMQRTGLSRQSSTDNAILGLAVLLGLA